MTRNRPRPSRRAILGAAAVTALTPATAAATTGAATPRPTWPTEFPLPDGWLPEGITIGARPYAYFGSRAHGGILRTDLRTGTSRILHPGAPGSASIGLKLDRDGLLYVAGGGAGTARIVDARTGELVRTYQLTAPSGQFVNDVVLHEDRAWFTDSRAPVLYGVPRHGAGEVRELPLTGAWEQLPDVINANGIVATPDGRGLIVVKSAPGTLYRVSPRTGKAAEIALVGQDSVVNGDGLYRVGRTLYVVQNRLNKVSVWHLNATSTSATLTGTITDPRFDVPTTAARYGNRLYLVNARFTSPQTPETTFTAVAVEI
ncbi:superoxide dismutase [Streptomyces sp. JB150]|uniref:SMP-30/gluconolactonase/LRE family protein n=1 Tax=Streptomyces sp. JB150 TaxID=2714844 RepID=UPI0014086A77|nr:superoxide dismutase [Streptomyces sp. JB150]QIJ62464.1 superoxide dismutase [Streptomyces sp. JB150]